MGEGELVFCSVQFEDTAGDPIGATANDAGNVTLMFPVSGKIVMSQNNIAHPALVVGNHQSEDQAAIVGDGCLDPAGFGKSKTFDFQPVFGLAKGFA